MDEMLHVLENDFDHNYVTTHWMIDPDHRLFNSQLQKIGLIWFLFCLAALRQLSHGLDHPRSW